MRIPEGKTEEKGTTKAKRPAKRTKKPTPEVERLMNQLQRADQKVVDAEANAAKQKESGDAARSRATFWEHERNSYKEKFEDAERQLRQAKREVEELKRDMQGKDERYTALEAQHRQLGKAFVASATAAANRH